MKSRYLKKFAAGILVATMAVTAVPAVSQIVNPTVTAEAKTKKAKKASVEIMGGFFGENVLVGKYDCSGQIVVSDYSKKAKYSITANSKNVKITKFKQKKQFGALFLNCDLEAKKPGTYTISVKEKLNGKTRKLGSKKLYVKEPELLKESLDVYLGSDEQLGNLMLDYGFPLWNWKITEGYKKVIDVDDDEYGTYNIKPIAEGTAKIKFTDFYKRNVGTVTISVKTNHCTGIELNKDEAYYYDDDENEITGAKMYVYPSDSDYDEDREYGIDKYYNILSDAGDNTPTEEKVQVAAADPTMLDIKYESTDEYDGWYATALKAGDTSIHVTCGSYSLDIPVHIEKYSDYDSEDEDY